MPIDTHGRPVSTSTTATDPATACPYCRATAWTRRTSDTGRARAWACDRCDTSWAYTVPDSRAATLLSDLGATVQEIRWQRWILRQLVMLADDAPALTDQHLRARLLALAESCAQ